MFSTFFPGKGYFSKFSQKPTVFLNTLQQHSFHYFLENTCFLRFRKQDLE